MNEPFPYLSIFYNLHHYWITEITNKGISKQLWNLSLKNFQNICFISFQLMHKCKKKVRIGNTKIQPDIYYR